MTQIVDGPRPKTGALSVSTRFETVTRPVKPAEELTVLPPGTAAWMTLLVPTRNEVDNVRPLLERLAAACGEAPVEVLFVDDSTDSTPDEIRAAARGSGLAVRLLHRAADERAGGLGSAVVAGLQQARGSWAVVMDADLQHPPELATKLVAVGQSRGVDLVVGTRYVPGGEANGLGGAMRHAVSGTATRLTKALFPRRLAHVSDPMSGLFAIRLAALDVERLDPIGFKILLEIAVRNRSLRVAEVPFVFGERLTGDSKASMREGARFLRHLTRLRIMVLRNQVKRSSARSRAQRLRTMLAFGLVGLTGLAVNEGALWLLALRLFHHHYLLGAVLATEVSTIWNFALTESFVYRGRKPGTLVGRGVRFALLNNAALLLRLPLLALLVEGFGIGVLVGNFVTLALMFFVRFVVADAAIFAPSDSAADAADAPAPPPKQPMRLVVHVPTEQLPPVSEIAAPVEAALAPATRPPSRRYLPYRYAIDGVLTIGSQVPLPELEYFRAQWVGSDVDLAIRVAPVGDRGPRSRAMMTQYLSPPALSYQEHFGRLGANFRVEIGDPVQVTCSPALAKSPHVLYTNVIEALLRFIAVSRGVILLHSACLELNGSGLLLSARTDTGKTGTVLRLLRERGALFLSDDMTIVDRSGVATCYPKPLTISHHTLRAVQAGDLSRAEWRRLRLQSRLHSKEGRDFGLILAGMNIPIMGINSLTQRMVPPPKYAVDRLVECRIVRTTTVENLFVIERGAPDLAELPFDETIQTLVENTDDAYGFPPFRQMAPSIVIGSDDYAELRVKEREILTAAMSRIRARRIASDDFSWSDRIAELLAPEAHRPSSAAGLAG
jgi:putative flippase GtrA